MAREPSPMKFEHMMIKYRGVVLTVFAMICLFLIAVVIYKHFYPSAFPGMERRTLFVLVPLGLLTIALWFPYNWAAIRLKSLRVRWLSSTLQPLLDRAAARLRSLRARIDISRLVKKGISIIFLALLILVVLEAVFNWGFLQDYQTALIVATIAFGALTLWLNRDKIDLEAETKEEELGEAERKKEFGENFPKVNRIPVLKWFVRWMYKEGWVYSIGLITVLLIGAFLRFWHLGNLGYIGDDILHVFAARGILENGVPVLPSGFIYIRGLVHSYLVASSFFMFGESEFATRIPGVLFSIGTIYLVYFIGREMLNKRAGLLAAAMLSFSFWEVEMARYARMHSQFQLLFLLSTYLFYKGFLQDNRKYKVFCVISIILAVFTLQQAFALLILFPLILFLLLGHHKVFTKENIVLSAIIVVSFISRLLMEQLPNVLQTLPAKVGASPTLTEKIFQNVTFPPVSYFYDLSWTIYPAFLATIILAIWFIIRSGKVSKLYPFYIYVFAGSLTFISCMESKLQPRIIFYIIPLLFLLFSYSSVKILSFIRWKRIQSALFLMVVVALISGLFLNSSLGIPQRDYGDSLHPYKTISAASRIYPDYKTTAVFVKEHFAESYDETIIISVAGVTLFHFYYLDHKPDYLLISKRQFVPRGLATIEPYTGIPILRELDTLKRLLKSSKEDVIIITAYSSFPETYVYNTTTPIVHVTKDISAFLEKNNDKVVYWGKDGISRVYVFDSSSEVFE